MLKRNVQLAPYTTFGIGGRARYFISVSTSVGLVKAVCLAKKNGWPYFVIAGGSNVVFGDKLFNGLVIHYQIKNSRFDLSGFLRSNLKSWQGQSLTMNCEAGISLVSLISFSIKRGLAGLESLAGIPGTVGGAIVGNAGAYGQCISDFLVRVEIFDPTISLLDAVRPKGRTASGVRWLTKKQCRFAYRESIFKKKNWLVLRAEFRLRKGNQQELINKSREIIKIRSEKYDPSLCCPGSFFKNVLYPQGLTLRTRQGQSLGKLAKIDPAKIRDGKISAGYLLEQVGAKGMRRGGVRVADFHGNLLINDGGATCREVKLLANTLKRRVHKKFGIMLEEEVRYML